MANTKKESIVGYTTGVYDLFHIGHLNILKKSKSLCDYLIVGVSTDEVVEKNKNKKPVIPFEERLEIIKSIRYVDKAIPQTGYDIQNKIDAVIKYGVNVVFVGTDWKGTEKWNSLEKELQKYNCKVVYLDYTEGISSTLLRKKICR